ncbi:hypothetical protein N8J89_41400 [Crossiella sp. CA-258035]|uniref:hypothetical protein n=1 Tax=Crossiella sp. CA-258035 TaxID=2981138 RepID=UPI0024BC7BE4|nr:hypothetical protein [Crossiella sp. CA-258035]WHT19466.1 hypothetical protein N8J89_41400 [Crossiella sp. CA-258035]
MTSISRHRPGTLDRAPGQPLAAAHPTRPDRIALATDLAVARVVEVRSGVELPARRTGDRWCVTVPETRVAAAVVFEG